MASITIRRLDDAVKKRLRERAARHGCSMEEEAREILRVALAKQEAPRSDWVAAIRREVDKVGGIDIPRLLREPVREPPDFS